MKQNTNVEKYEPGRYHSAVLSLDSLVLLWFPCSKTLEKLHTCTSADMAPKDVFSVVLSPAGPAASVPSPPAEASVGRSDFDFDSDSNCGSVHTCTSADMAPKDVFAPGPVVSVSSPPAEESVEHSDIDFNSGCDCGSVHTCTRADMAPNDFFAAGPAVSVPSPPAEASVRLSDFDFDSDSGCGSVHTCTSADMAPHEIFSVLNRDTGPAVSVSSPPFEA